MALGDFNPGRYGQDEPDWSTAVNAYDADPDANLARRVKLLEQVAPNIAATNMNWITTLAQSHLNDTELLDQTSEIVGLGVSSQEIQAYQHMDRDKRVQRWQAMAADRQEAFRALGYNGDLEVRTAGPDGLLDSVAGFLGKGASLSVGGIGKVGGFLLHYASAPQEELSHAYRAVDYLTREGTFSGAWARTSNGERYITRGGLRQAQEQMGGLYTPNNFDLAIRLSAAGGSPEEILADAGLEPGTAEYSAGYQKMLQIITDERFTKAVRTMSFAKISPGRQVARVLQLDPGSAPYMAVSGAVDGAWTLFADPLLVAGKVSKGVRAGKWAWDLLDTGANLRRFGLAGDDLVALDRAAAAHRSVRIEAIRSRDYGPYFKALNADIGTGRKEAVQKKFVMIADHFAAGEQAMLGDLDKTVNKIMFDLNDWDRRMMSANELEMGLGRNVGIQSPGDIVKWLDEADQYKSLATGKWSTWSHPGQEIPHLTRPQMLRMQARVDVGKVIDWANNDLPDLSLTNMDRPSKALASRGARMLDAVTPGSTDAARAVRTDTSPAGMAALSKDFAASLAANDKGAVANFIEPWAWRLMHPVGQLAKGLTLQPTRDVLQDAGENTFETLSRYLSFAFDNEDRRDFINRYFQAANHDGRLNVLLDAQQQMAFKAGLMQTEEGRDLVNRYVHASRQLYGGDDMMHMPVGVRHVGILPEAHQAYGTALMDFKQFQTGAAQSRRLGMHKLIFGRTGDMGDAFLSKIWKPSVLMRLGFIPRVAGEEALAATFMMGAFMAPSRWMGEIGSGPDSKQLAPFRSAVKFLSWGVPEEVRGKSAERLLRLDQLGPEKAELGALRQAQLFMAHNIVSNFGGWSTPALRELARRSQAGLIGLREITENSVITDVVARMTRGDERKVGPALDRLQALPERIRTRIVAEQQSSAAAGLAKAANYAGFAVTPEGRMVANLPPEELEQRLKMTGEMFRMNPRVQDAYVRALAGGFNQVSSKQASVFNPDVGSLSVDVMRPDGSVNTKRLKVVGSDFTKYSLMPGIMDPDFDHGWMYHWQLQNKLVPFGEDRVTAAALHAASLYVDPAQATEVADRLGLGRNGFEVTRQFREMLADAPEPLQRAVRRYVNSQDPGDLSSAMEQVAISRKAASLDVTQAKLVEQFLQAVPDFRHGAADMLVADIRRGRAAIADHRLSRIGFVHEEDVFTSARAAGARADELDDIFLPSADAQARADTLASRLERGDRDALVLAQRQAARNQLTADDFESKRRLSSRNNRTADGQEMTVPIPDNHTRLYGILADPEDIQFLLENKRDELLAAITDAEVRPLVNAMLNEANNMPTNAAEFAAERADMLGAGGQVAPATNLVLADPQIADRVKMALDEAMAAFGAQSRIGGTAVGQLDIHNDIRSRHLTGGSDELGIWQADSALLYKLDPGAVEHAVNHDMVIDDWLSKIMGETSIFVGKEGRVLHELARPVLERTFDRQHLMRVDNRDLPDWVQGPRYVEAQEGIWTKIVRYGFDKVIGPGIDAMVREPLFAENYMRARQANRGIEDLLMDHDLQRRAAEVAAKHGLKMDDVEEAFALVPEELRLAHGPKNRLPEVGRIRQHLPEDMAGLTDDQLLNLHRDMLSTGGRPKPKAQPPRYATDDALIDTRVAQIESNRGRAGAAWVDEQKDKLAGELGITRAQLDARDYQLKPATPIETTGERIWTDDELRGELQRQGFPDDQAEIDALRATKTLEAAIEAKVTKALQPPPNDRMERMRTALPDHLVDPNLDPDIIDPNDLRRALVDHSDLAGLTDGELGVLRTWLTNREATLGIANQVAMERAVNDTIPFIDDSNVRSQFSDWVRHLMPFEFAQEQFLKRWARVLIHSPESLREAQLLFQGLTHSGVITQDEYGNDVYVFPGSHLITSGLAKGLQAIGIGDYTLPMAVPMTGNVRHTIPGIGDSVIPGTSPFISVSLQRLSQRFPEITLFQDLEETVVGERGADRPILDNLMPTVVGRTYSYFSKTDPEKDQKLASATIQVMAMMMAKDAKHHRETGEHLFPGLDDQAGAEQIEAFNERVANFARTLQLTRLLFGFAAPASPTPKFEADLHPYLQRLLRAMPNDPGAAFAEFIHQYPDATAFTVFGTQSVSGAPLPPTEVAGEFLANNADFVRGHRYAASWLLPQSDSTHEFNRQTYHEMLAFGLRVSKSPKEWYRDAKFAAAAPAYFASSKAHAAAMEALANDPMGRRQEQEEYAAWKKSYFDAHPIFHQELISTEGKQKRMDVLRDMETALYAPNVPSAPHVEPLRVLVEEHQRFQIGLASLASRRDRASVIARDELKLSFATWVNEHITTNPGVRAFYSRILEPDLDLPEIQTGAI